MSMKETNPKDAIGAAKLPLHMVPSTLSIFAAMGFAEGDSKYIAYNFRIAGIRASVYISAQERHWAKWKNGEWADAKTGIPHLASVAACTAIIIDGYVCKTIVDDRPPPVLLADEIERAEEIIAKVYAMNKAVRPVGVEYTVLTHPLPTIDPNEMVWPELPPLSNEQMRRVMDSLPMSQPVSGKACELA